jgi:hypothetical protein
MNYIAIFMLFLPMITWAKCSDNIPDQLVEVDIKSCKTVPMKMSKLYVDDGLWKSTIIKANVVESVIFPLSSPFGDEHAIKDSNIFIAMSLHDTKNCEKFGNDILSKEPVTLIVRKMCCDAGQAYCKEAKYWGYELPFYPKNKGGYKTDLNFDFDGSPDIGKYYKQRELIRKMSEKDELESKPAT